MGYCNDPGKCPMKRYPCPMYLIRNVSGRFVNNSVCVWREFITSFLSPMCSPMAPTCVRGLFWVCSPMCIHRQCFGHIVQRICNINNISLMAWGIYWAFSSAQGLPKHRKRQSLTCIKTPRQGPSAYRPCLIYLCMGITYVTGLSNGDVCVVQSAFSSQYAGRE